MPTVPAKSYPVSHTAAVTVGATAAPLVAANADRACVSLQNVGAVDVFVSSASDVTASGAKVGWKVPGNLTPPAEYVNPWAKGPLYIIGAAPGGSVVVDDAYPE